MPHALIIDDNRNNIDVLTMLLEREGVSQTAVQSARQVSKTLDQIDKVDVVFLDLEFPTGDGFQVLKAVKVDPRLRGCADHRLYRAYRAKLTRCAVQVSTVFSVSRWIHDGFPGRSSAS